jgi:hypothetical protein
MNVYQANEANDEDSHLNVLVAYEDFAAGTRAMAMLKRVGNQCGRQARLIHTMWRFDVLSDASYFELAVSEALAADIIVISAREGKSLPQRIREWISHWLLMKIRRPVALVATLDYPQVRIKREACVLPYLAKLAHYGNMPFFANGGGRANGNGLAPINVRHSSSVEPLPRETAPCGQF